MSDVCADVDADRQQLSSTSCVSSRHYHMHPISGSNQEYDAPRKTTGLCLGSGVLHEAAVLQLDGDNNQS